MSSLFDGTNIQTILYEDKLQCFYLPLFVRDFTFIIEWFINNTLYTLFMYNFRVTERI